MPHLYAQGQDVNISDVVRSVVQAPWETSKLSNKTGKLRQVGSHTHSLLEIELSSALIPFCHDTGPLST